MVNRQQVCPFLLRTVIANKLVNAEENDMSDDDKVSIASDGLVTNLHVWEDMSLRELATLIQHQVPESLDLDCELSFQVAYADSGGQVLFENLGMVHSFKLGNHDRIKLNETIFRIGDSLVMTIQQRKKQMKSSRNVS